MIMNPDWMGDTDWMALFLAALVGAATSWTFFSLWAVRMIDQAKRDMRQQQPSS